jgi:hypothetical protein
MYFTNDFEMVPVFPIVHCEMVPLALIIDFEVVPVVSTIDFEMVPDAVLLILRWFQMPYY